MDGTPNDQPEVATSSFTSLLEYGHLVLNTHDGNKKADFTMEAVKRYKDGELSVAPSTSSDYFSSAINLGGIPQCDIDLVAKLAPPSSPARPTHLTVLPSNQMPTGKKGMTPQKRVIALLHSFCHIESFAIDLSWDVLCRFILSNNQISLKPTSTDSTNETTATTTTTDPTTAPAQPAEKTQSDIVLVADEGGDSDDTKEQGRKQPETVVLPVLPDAFFEDWLRIAGEEALHYGLWRDRLIELGSFYGALPVHDGLWQSAGDTNHDILARLAIVHMVHEARGLDVAPKRTNQLIGAGDKKSAKILERIEIDEVTHVGSGMRWYMHLCNNSTPQIAPMPTFHNLVKTYFQGSLRPPFAVEVRSSVGFTPEWYWPLVHEKFRDSFLQKAQKTAEKKARQEAERQALRDKNIKIKQQHMERIQREKAEKERQKLKDADADADANEREVVEKSMAELNVE